MAVVIGAGPGPAWEGDDQDLAMAGVNVDSPGPEASMRTAASVATGTQVLALPTVVTDEHQVGIAFARVVAEVGRVDVLINNAGRQGPLATVDEVGVVDWRATVEVKLTACSLRRGGVLCDADPGPAHRRHHQQRLDLEDVPRPTSARTLRQSTA